MTTKIIDSSATFSPCRQYRYSLWRRWDTNSSEYAMFIGLNPSTANEVEDDPTIRRCIQFSKNLGYGALCMTNLFAFRSATPLRMKAETDPIGPENDAVLIQLGLSASVIVAAWGTHGTYLNRAGKIIDLFSGRLHCLRTTKYGHPSHPLYLPKSLTPIPYPI